MLPRESMHRLCWPMEEVRPADEPRQVVEQVGGWADSGIEPLAAAPPALCPARLGSLAARPCDQRQPGGCAATAPVLSSWPCLNTFERAKPRPSSSTERVSTPTMVDLPESTLPMTATRTSSGAPLPPRSPAMRRRMHTSATARSGAPTVGAGSCKEGCTKRAEVGQHTAGPKVTI